MKVHVAQHVLQRFPGQHAGEHLLQTSSFLGGKHPFRLQFRDRDTQYMLEHSPDNGAHALLAVLWQECIPVWSNEADQGHAVHGGQVGTKVGSAIHDRGDARSTNVLGHGLGTAAG